MNIAFVLPYLAERFGGPVTVVKNVGGALASAGHNVSYWGTADNSDREEVASMAGAHIYDVVWPRSWYRSTGLVRGLSAGIGSVDILHISGFWLHPTYAASRIARTNGIPYIVSLDGCLEPWAMRSSPLKWWKKRIYLDLVGKSIMQGAACIHAKSAQESEHFCQAGYRRPVTIIPNGVDTDEFTSGDRSEAEAYWPNLRDRLVVLFMSRLSPEKGLDLLIPAWADVVKCPAYKDAVLVIAGPDDRGYRTVVERLIDRFNISSGTCMTGMVRGQKKLALLRRANVFVLPSYSENFGIVVAEALSCGTPVITTTATPWQQLQEIDAGRWVPPEQGEVGQALRELLNMSDSQRKAMGHRGMTLIKQNYTWDRVVPKFLTVYNCILSGKPIPLHP
jgi:glycosyltransferase involved in cell wall biosynthesis